MPFNVYLFTYRYQGAPWVLQIKAASESDAKARLRHLTNATYDGEQLMFAPLPDPRPINEAMQKLWGRLLRIIGVTR